jgi:hypothetical protein
MRRAWLAALALGALLAFPSVASAASDNQTLASPTDLPLASVAYNRAGDVAVAVGGIPGHGVVVRIAGGQANVASQDAPRLLAIAWSPAGGPALLVGDGMVMRTPDGERFERASLPEGLDHFDGRAVAWKPDGSEALLAGSALLRYRADSGALEVVRASADEAYAAVGWSPDGTIGLLEQSRREGARWVTGRLLTWDGAALTHVATFGEGDALVTSIAWEPAGRWALIAGARAHDGPAMRWDGNALAAAFVKPADRFTAVAWQPGQGRALLTGSGGERLATSDGASYQPLLDGGPDLLGAAWHPSGQRALLVGAGGLLQEWMPEGKPLIAIRWPPPNAVLQGTVELFVRATPRAGHPITGVEGRVDEGSPQPLPRWERDAWHWVLPTSSLADGVHLLEVRAQDDGMVGDAARVQVRVANGAVPPPRFVNPPARDDDGLLELTWTNTRADAYEVEASLEASFAGAEPLVRTRDPGAMLALPEPGTHHLRVRGVLGESASAWSSPAAVEVTLSDSPFLPKAVPTTSEGSATPASDEGPTAKTPALQPMLALAAVAALAWARARARRRA